jgi:hypothetical protein
MSPRAPRLRAALLGALGLFLGLALTEGAFRMRDGGAFPLVNIFAPDELRGVRLRRGSETRVGSRAERVTHVRVNADGYRGPAWPDPSEGEVLVVGDSLSFGLGVDEDEALPARLHAALAAHPAVIDASVPTYGPPEYLLTMEELLRERRPAAAVLVLNALNDFDEIDRPNTARHLAVDGWAVRVREGAPPPEASPIREAVIQRSHAAFALWRWQRTRELPAAPPAPADGVGTLLALAAARDKAMAAVDDVKREAEAPSDLSLLEYQGWRREEARLFALVRKYAGSLASAGLWSPSWDGHLDDEREEGRQFLLLGCGWSREALERSQNAQRAHRGMRAALERLPRVATLAPEAAAEIDDAFARAEAARKEAARPRPAPVPPPGPPPVPMEGVLVSAHALTEAARARLVVVIVPLDAQVSPEAQARHALGDAQIASLDRLLSDVATRARALGATVVEPASALRRASAPAYLPDGHLSAVGHETVARRVAEAMDAHPGGV